MNGYYSKPPLYLFGRSNPSLRHCKGRLFYFQSSPSCYVKDGEATLSQRGPREAPVGCGRSSHLQKPGCGRKGLAGGGVGFLGADLPRARPSMASQACWSPKPPFLPISATDPYLLSTGPSLSPRGGISQVHSPQVGWAQPFLTLSNPRTFAYLFEF